MNKVLITMRSALLVTSLLTTVSLAFSARDAQAATTDVCNPATAKIVSDCCAKWAKHYKRNWLMVHGCITREGGGTPLFHSTPTKTPEDPDGEDPDGEDPDGEDPDGEDPDGEDPDGEDPDGEDPDGEDDQGNNGHGNDTDGNDDSNPGNSNDTDDTTDDDGTPGNSGNNNGGKKDD